MERCVRCKGAVEAAELDDEVKVGRHTVAGPVGGWRCVACGATYYSGPALERFELAAAARLLDAGAVGGDVLRFARKALGLTAVELGALLDVRAETLSRWETGAQAAEGRAVALLGALVRDRIEGREDTARRLRAIASPEKLPRRVEIGAAGAR